MFMQLLATELQSQDPTQTMDPTTMVTQMVQINQLSDVAGIYSILQGPRPAARGQHLRSRHCQPHQPQPNFHHHHRAQHPWEATNA